MSPRKLTLQDYQANRVIAVMLASWELLFIFTVLGCVF